MRFRFTSVSSSELEEYSEVRLLRLALVNSFMDLDPLILFLTAIMRSRNFSGDLENLFRVGTTGEAARL